ncbi:TPA: hypothetical protein ACGXGV_001546 [Bacillus paranthracis]|uniref:hypothetical protein n=1 Tax=Bacillus sp. ME5 TaxID=2744251 RepID=UPI0015F4A456|nr:hypothetical protein [Bacillus sp. ME5]
MEAYEEDARAILSGLKSITSTEYETEFRERTKSALGEIEKAFEAFVNGGCRDGYSGLNKLLTNFVVSYTDEIKEEESISVSKEVKLKLRGDSGEYFVAAELCRRNILVALPPQNAPLFDIIASDFIGEKTAYIQVKTTIADNQWGSHWHLNNSFLQKKSNENLFVVLVDATEHPQYYIFRYNELVDIVKACLKLKGAKSKAEKSRDIVRFALGDTFSDKEIIEMFMKNGWNIITDYLQNK